MSDPAQLSPAELVTRVRSAYGLTWAELGAAMNRSPRMMQKIARGETSGESYRDALTELHETGAVSKAPRCRRNAAGKIVPVRAKRGAKKPTVVPKDTRRGPSLTRHSTTTTHLPDGNRIVRIQLPKTVGSPERGAGLHAARMSIVNVARGSVIDEKALVAALTDGTIAGAGLDVFAQEPHAPDALTALPNVVLSPHLGGHTLESHVAMQDCVLANLDAFFAGTPLPYKVSGT